MSSGIKVSGGARAERADCELELAFEQFLDGYEIAQAIGLIHEKPWGFEISFPDFPDCLAHGCSVEDARRRGEEALAFHVTDLFEDQELARIRVLSELNRDPEFVARASRGRIVKVGVYLRCC